jgi:hypothetical protein
MAPILFGTRENQELLIRIRRDGLAATSEGARPTIALTRSGLVARKVAGGASYVLDGLHPAIEAIVAVLGDLTGDVAAPLQVCHRKQCGNDVDVDRPLGHRVAAAFPVLLEVTRTDAAVPLKSLHLRFTEISRRRIDGAVGQLVSDGILASTGQVLSLAADVPQSYRRLVLELGAVLAKRDPRFAATRAMAASRVAAFIQNEDGAPLLFGSDVRLRNLMALAKHGPMHLSEIKLFSGVDQAKLESVDEAPFGRAGLVRAWTTSGRVAVELDAAMPVAVYLRRLLCKLEERFPLPSDDIIVSGLKPQSPPPARWAGDRQALFGGPIVTNILMSIGALGWTFEALCVAAGGGYDRVVIKKAIRKLEDAGIIESTRPRRPGFNVRVLTIAKGFCAADELTDLLNACVVAWPDVAKRVETALEHLPLRTKEHLRLRKLIPVAPGAGTINLGSVYPNVRGTLECMGRYHTLSLEHGFNPSSHALMTLDANLYRTVKSLWGSFAAFRKDSGLAPKMSGVTRTPCSALRKRCIDDYGKLARAIGFHPNTSDLNRLDPWLSELIRIQWGGFPQFVRDLHLRPAKTQCSRNAVDADARADCRTEYRSLMSKLGYAPSSWELRLHTRGLYKRIKKRWKSFEAFCDEIDICPPRRRIHGAGSRNGSRWATVEGPKGPNNRRSPTASSFYSSSSNLA